MFAFKKKSLTQDNYPLHYAVKFCLKRDGFRGLRVSLVDPLIAKMPPGSLGDENRSGVTCRHLLRGLDLKQQLATQQLSTDTSEDDDDASWDEKLANADYEDRAEEGFESSHRHHQFANDYKETYDQWADRIYTEFVKRRKYVASSSSRPTSKTNDRKRTPEESAFKIQTKPLKLPPPPVLPSQAHRKYTALFSLTRITVEDLPFDENSTSDEIISVILSDDKGPSKQSIREAVRKWHPDKFSQMYGAYVVETDRPRVMQIVTRVSQVLLTYGKT